MDRDGRKDYKGSNRPKSKNIIKKSRYPSKNKPHSSQKRNIMRETKFVTLNSTNIKMIKDYFKTIAQNLYDLFAQSNNYVLYQFEGRTRDVFLVPTSMSKIVRKLSINLPVMHAGIHLGFVKPKRTHSGYVRGFFLSYEGGRFIYEFIINNHLELLKDIQTIQLNAKGERSFLYGKEIVFEDVISNTSKLIKKKIIFVLNQKDNYIGIALLLVKQAG